METPVELMPPVNPVVATGVLSEVDNIIDWKDAASVKFDRAGVRLSRLIAEVCANAYWTFRGYSSEVDYVKKTFSQSDSQYYILRRVGIELKEYPLSKLEKIGISKCQDLVRVKKHDGIIGPNWFIWAESESRDVFRRRVRVYLGPALPLAHTPEDWMLTLKIWVDAIPVVKKAFEIAALYAGTNKSLSHLFVNFICPEWLSGVDETGARLSGHNNFCIMMVGRFIRILKIGIDETVIDRLLGEFRSALFDLKDKK